MADTYYSDWARLTGAISKKAIVQILKKDVAPVAEDILAKRIQIDIYDAYTPKSGGFFAGKFYTNAYRRRHELEKKIKSYMIDDKTLLITSTANASKSLVSGWSFQNRYDGAFLEMLEVGNMGVWRKGFPRPVVRNTQTEIDRSSLIKSAIKKGIKREINIK